MRMAIYSALGVKKTISPSINRSRLDEAAVVVHSLFGSNPTKGDVEELRVRGVLIGDLVYDSYLRTKSLPTIDPGSRSFRRFLKKFVLDTLFWLDYIEPERVAAVAVSHTVYGNAILIRVAASRSIPAFQAKAESAYRLDSREFFAYKEFKDFPRVFRSLDTRTQNIGREQAKKRLSLRFEGAVGVDMHYSTASAYTARKSQRLLARSDATKVLVATHCFFDSPHAYGMNLFPDFWEWLNFLGEISERTSYEWYLKTHRDFLPGNIPILEYFTKRYPRFSLLPTESSHHQIIEEGIDVALTVFGTIGFEYPYLGVPVINASVNNPHIAYSFNYHPSSLESYEELLLDIPNLQKPGERERREIEEFYFMKHLLHGGDLFFRNWELLLEKIGGYKAQFTPLIYQEFLDQWTPERHQEILNRLSSFIQSEDYLITGETKLRIRSTEGGNG